MSNTLKSLRALADPTRLRLVALLEQGELSVNELQEITGMGQSRISTHLGILQENGLIASRREGKRTFYSINLEAEGIVREFTQLSSKGARELPEYATDQMNLKHVLHRRQEQAQVYFNQQAGRFDRVYGPGRSWQGFAHLFLRILPPIEVADLGAGEGFLSEMLAQQCRKVIAIDNSEKMIAFGRNKAWEKGLKNLEFRLGDLENPPIEPNSLDAVILSQALHHALSPASAIANAFSLLKAGGQIVILDLLEHQFEKARILYGDRWLGFTEAQIQEWLEEAGFENADIRRVSKDSKYPYLITLLACAAKQPTKAGKQPAFHESPENAANAQTSSLLGE